MSNLKSAFQKKILSANNLSNDRLINRFAYIHRSEHLNNCALNSKEPGVLNEKYCSSEVIVSLTTYDNRLYEVYLAIESIMQQSLKPNRIILWLSDDLENVNMPRALRNQQKRGLEIKYCKDIRSYKKLIPALKAFPSAVILTIDDDRLYYFDLIENMINAYNKNPKLIYCTSMRRMNLLSKNMLEKYYKWSKEKYSDASPLNFPVGGGGVLYPPNCFSDEVFNENVFWDICKYADDVWFKAMALLNGTMAQRIFTHNKNGSDTLTNKISEHTALNHINRKMNDIQLKAVFDKYGLYEKLTNYQS